MVKEQQSELRKEATQLLRDSHEKELQEVRWVQTARFFVVYTPTPTMVSVSQARRQREVLEVKVNNLRESSAQLKAQLETLEGSLSVTHSNKMREMEEAHLKSMQETIAESKKASDKRYGLLQEKHRMAIEDLKESHQQEMEKAKEVAEAKLTKELTAARAETQKLLSLLEKDKVVCRPHIANFEAFCHVHARCLRLRLHSRNYQKSTTNSSLEPNLTLKKLWKQNLRKSLRLWKQSMQLG